MGIIFVGDCEFYISSDMESIVFEQGKASLKLYNANVLATTIGVTVNHLRQILTGEQTADEINIDLVEKLLTFKGSVHYFPVSTMHQISLSVDEVSSLEPQDISAYQEFRRNNGRSPTYIEMLLMFA